MGSKKYLRLTVRDILISVFKKEISRLKKLHKKRSKSSKKKSKKKKK